jgi:hypothetical protein
MAVGKDVDTKNMFRKQERIVNSEKLWKGVFTSTEFPKSQYGELEIWLPEDLDLTLLDRKGMTMKYKNLLHRSIYHLTLQKLTSAGDNIIEEDEFVIFSGEHGSTKFMFKCVEFTDKVIHGIYNIQNPEDQGTFTLYRDDPAPEERDGGSLCPIL